MYTKPEVRGIIHGFFTGAISNELIFPSSVISDEELLNLTILNENLQEFCQSNIDPGKIIAEDTITPDVFQGLADIGFFALEVPEEYGGYGFSLYSYLKTVEVLAARSPAVAAAVGSLNSLGMKSIRYFGNEQQKKEHLQSFASGEDFIAFALTEESAGSDLNAIEAKSYLSEDEDFFIISGVKKFVGNAGIAKHAIVLAKTEVDIRGRMRERISAYIVPLASDGLTLSRKWDKLGMQGLDVYEVKLENVRIPRGNILGQPGQGFNIAMTVLNEARLSQAAGCIGAMKVLHRQAINAMKKRRQFGRQLIEFELIEERISRMIIDIFVAESMVYLTASLAGRPGIDFSSEAAACKVFATDALWNISNTLLQLAGGEGYMRGSVYEQAMRDARMHQIVNGTNEVLRLYIALSGLKFPESVLRGFGENITNPFQNPTTAFRSIYSFATQRFGRLIPADILPIKSIKLLSRFIHQLESLNVDEDLVGLSQLIEKAIRAFSGRLEVMILKNGHLPMERELQLERIAHCVVQLFAATATLSRLQSLIALKGKSETSIEKKIASVFIAESIVKIEAHLSALDGHHDTDILDIASQSVQEERYNLGLSKYNFVS